MARGDFAAVYTLVSGSGACALLQGELLSVQSYSVPRSASDTRPDPDRTSLGIQPGAITDLLGTRDPADAEPDDRPYALGAFDSAKPHGDGFCAVPVLSSARLRLPAADARVDACMDTPAQPPLDIEYEFSNVQVYVSASDYGTQLAADLTYTRDGCSAKYRVRAVYPAVPCGVSTDAGVPADDAGAPQDETDDAQCQEPETGEQLPDDSLCAALPDYASGSYMGSGLNPDLAVSCDPTLLLCVLQHEPPSRP